jgi:sugar/nucleoside kinase (ribokinase family)
MRKLSGGPEIIVVGHILNEKIVFPDRVIAPVLGSPAAYSSVCLASLGVTVGIVTKIGRDFPPSLLGVFDECGVLQDGLHVGRASTNNELIYDDRGYKTLRFLTRAENLYLCDIPDTCLGARLIYVCPMDHEVGHEAVRELSGLGKVMAVDLGGYGGGTTAVHPTEKTGDEVRALCPSFTIVKASIEDCGYIFGAGSGDERRIAGTIITWGARICVITLGERGSFVMTGGREEYVPAFPIANLTDQTGAGDCYAAGYLAHFLRSGDPFASAVYATAATSYVIERTGGVIAGRMPNAQEVERRAEIIRSRMGR